MSITWRVPGRIELFGKHTDYAGGQVLVCAVDHGVTVTVTPGGDRLTAETSAFPDRVVLGSQGTAALPAGHWGRYVQTVVDRLTANFGPLRPCHLRLASDLPPASGMSSSSAMLSGVALALADLNGFSDTDRWRRACPDRLSLAGYLACVENGKTWGELAGAAGVGTRGGSEDHTAMLCGRAGTLTQASFDPLAIVRTVPFPDDLTLVVAVSGVLAEKTGPAMAAYNAAAAMVADLLAAWNLETGRRDASLAAAVTFLAGPGPVGPDDPALAPLLELAEGAAQQARLRHFVGESFGFVPAAAASLAAGRPGDLGELARASQSAAESLLGNQIPQTVHLAASAYRFGAGAASAFGAGFGGSVWALVRRADAPGFATAWLDDYHAAFPGVRGSTLITRPGAAAVRLGGDR